MPFESKTDIWQFVLYILQLVILQRLKAVLDKPVKFYNVNFLKKSRYWNMFQNVVANKKTKASLKAAIS